MIFLKCLTAAYITYLRLLISYILEYIYIIINYNYAEPAQVTVRPQSCICPSDGYTCQAYEVFQMKWLSDTFTESDVDDLLYSVLNGGSYQKKETTGFRANFTGQVISSGVANMTSTLVITDPIVNGTQLTCESKSLEMTRNETLEICIVGEAMSGIGMGRGAVVYCSLTRFSCAQ